MCEEWLLTLFFLKQTEHLLLATADRTGVTEHLLLTAERTGVNLNWDHFFWLNLLEAPLSLKGGSIFRLTTCMYPPPTSLPAALPPFSSEHQGTWEGWTYME